MRDKGAFTEINTASSTVSRRRPVKSSTRVRDVAMEVLFDVAGEGLLVNAAFKEKEGAKGKPK